MMRFTPILTLVWIVLMLSAVLGADGPSAPAFSIESFLASLIEKNVVAGLLVYSVYWFTRVYYPKEADRRDAHTAAITSLTDEVRSIKGITADCPHRSKE